MTLVGALTIVVLAAKVSECNAAIAGGGCVLLGDLPAAEAKVANWEEEIQVLSKADLLEDLSKVRKRVHGVVWRLNDFEVEVLKQQQSRISAFPVGPGWPSIATREAVDAKHEHCLQLSQKGSVGWKGCHGNSSRCYQPAGVSSNYKHRDGPYGTPEGINSLEDEYTESFQRTGLNTPPCCVHHLLEMVFLIHALLSEASALLGSPVPWQIGSGTLISAFRVGRLLPWEFDADIYIRMPQSTLTSKMKQVAASKENSTEIYDFYYWLQQKLRRAGYRVLMQGSAYWQVEYSKDNAIYVDIVWPEPDVFDGLYGGSLPMKEVELHGYHFPYYMDLAFEYGEGWVIPNRGGECIGRCSTLTERVARLRCSCLCAREPSRVVDARWHLQHWRLESYLNSSTARLARAVVAEAAEKSSIEAGEEICESFSEPEKEEKPSELLKLLKKDRPAFLEFVKALRSNSKSDKLPNSCEDFKEFCFGWFGDLVRKHCQRSCEIEEFVGEEHGFSLFFKALFQNVAWLFSGSPASSALLLLFVISFFLRLQNRNGTTSSSVAKAHQKRQ
eukprot:TRINITY_DN93226_c0_g1_i1.p1 TRINITY_DN93226_c0_g1~~TRINITY_DN93226_c0_g1_i1.p1  ORF type:complete len:578 (-),score=106.23 TRINITY_DN93226_c0_g1_i1:19-1692(-)